VQRVNYYFSSDCEYMLFDIRVVNIAIFANSVFSIGVVLQYFLITSASLSSVSTHGTGFSPGPSVGRSVDRSACPYSIEGIVTKQLSRYGCCLGW